MPSFDKVIRYLAAILVCFGLSAQPQALEPRTGWRIVQTDTAYGELVERLTVAIQAEGMLLVTQASASDGARMNGVTIPGNRVFGVYRNDYARRMLDASMAAGIEAPIRYYVTENGDGTATLSWKTPSFVFEPYLGEGGEALEALARELDEVFAAIASRATATAQ
ncbi:hypothetical protein GCM10011316_18990 [Roseibium aquae]|uniref:DUF302 domain-containing protein n=1 Tax=Roseibium aquae TaxID=1323746 RepID=A0A916X0C9_9HYPH|nr:DUF302 domain-containing protein [Roseibium aquae]GGB47055.1 hypothetical protein GCM10011316_18990 [Roseibium aquae]